MIIGVTHDHDGRVVQRLSVSTKVSIGLPPNGDRNHTTKLDHFVFLRKKKSANRVEWEADPELARHYGEQCRELHIMLIDDDIENVFPSCYAWWTAIERKCWGDGVTAPRRTPDSPGGQPWPQCGNGCPELASGLCKPSGDLRLVRQLWERDISLTTAETALLLASVRRAARRAAAIPLGPIRSLHYFLPVIEELLHTPLHHGDAYLASLRRKVPLRPAPDRATSAAR